MEHFTPISSLLGGMLIGLSASVLLLCNGKVAGISGIVDGILNPTKGDALWRVLFLAGLLISGFAFTLLAPERFAFGLPRSTAALVLAGLLVGYGTRLGGGCTSGHGVCGLSRFSPRSLVATLAFIATGAATVYVINHLFGGRV